MSSSAFLSKGDSAVSTGLQLLRDNLLVDLAEAVAEAATAAKTAFGQFEDEDGGIKTTTMGD